MTAQANHLNKYLVPDWPVSPRVQAYCTTRHGGFSQPPYDAFNLASHVGDIPEHVAQNRSLLRQELKLATAPYWLEQVHGADVLAIDADTSQQPTYRADSSYTRCPNSVCVILTADCLPILLASQDGNEVAAVHAGWRGLLAGVISNTLACFKAPRAQIYAWLGPAISWQHLELNATIQADFVRQHRIHQQAFHHEAGHCYGDLYQIARNILNYHGVENITGGQLCCFKQPKQFYSYRRDQRITGRMASLIWIN